MIDEKLKEAANSFLSTIREKDYSSHTVRNYKQKLNRLLKFCEENEFHKFTHEELADYLNFLNEKLEKSEIGRRYFGMLKGIAESFADYCSSAETYSFMPHSEYISAKNRLSSGNRIIYDNFAEYLKDNYAESSVRGHLSNIAQFLLYADSNSLSIDNVFFKDIMDYISYVSPRRPKSLDCVIDSIRMFIRHLYQENEIQWTMNSVMFRTPASRKKVPVVFSKDEVDSLLSCIDTSTPIGKRDYAIIVLALYSGLRKIDIVHLKLNDIDWENNTIHIIQHKTNRELTVPLLPYAGNCIADYILNGRKKSDSQYVFLSCARGKRNGGQIGCGAIINMMRNYLYLSGVKKAGSDGKDFHATRKTFATNMLKSGSTLETVASALGDSGTQSVKPYLSLNDEILILCCPEKMNFSCLKEGLNA